MGGGRRMEERKKSKGSRYRWREPKESRQSQTPKRRELKGKSQKKVTKAG